MTTPSAFSQAFGISAFESRELACLILDLSARLAVLATEQMSDAEAEAALLNINRTKLAIEKKKPTPEQIKRHTLNRLAAKKRIAEVNKARYQVLMKAAEASVEIADFEISELDQLMRIVENS